MAMERPRDSTLLTLQQGQGTCPGCFPEKSCYPHVVASDGLEGTWCSYPMASRGPFGWVFPELLWLAHLEKGKSPR